MMSSSHQVASHLLRSSHYYYNIINGHVISQSIIQCTIIAISSVTETILVLYVLQPEPGCGNYIISIGEFGGCGT